MHIMNAIKALLGGLASYVAVKCNNVLPENQNIAIAACIAMNNKDTIKEIIASDFPITADIFDVPELVPDPSNLIRETLLLEQSEIPGKPTTNQQASLVMVSAMNTPTISQIISHTKGTCLRALR